MESLSAHHIAHDASPVPTTSSSNTVPVPAMDNQDVDAEVRTLQIDILTGEYVDLDRLDPAGSPSAGSRDTGLISGIDHQDPSARSPSFSHDMSAGERVEVERLESTVGLSASLSHSYPTPGGPPAVSNSSQSQSKGVAMIVDYLGPESAPTVGRSDIEPVPAIKQEDPVTRVTAGTVLAHDTTVPVTGIGIPNYVHPSVFARYGRNPDYTLSRGLRRCNRGSEDCRGCDTCDRKSLFCQHPIASETLNYGLTYSPQRLRARCYACFKRGHTLLPNILTCQHCIHPKTLRTYDVRFLTEYDTVFSVELKAADITDFASPDARRCLIDMLGLDEEEMMTLQPGRRVA
jgi:hypothetical protein